MIVDDEERIVNFLRTKLKASGYEVLTACDGVDALERTRSQEPHLVVLDLMMPNMDGFEFLKELRTFSGIPVIILSAREADTDKIKGLQLGADDYLPKPFAFSELLARIQALIRRANSVAKPTTLTAGDLTMDIIKRKVFRAGVQIDLQPLEFALLEYLMRNAGRVVSKTMIMEHVWDYNFDPQTNVVEARICRLRDKIERPFKTKIIHTIRGAGYLLEERK